MTHATSGQWIDSALTFVIMIAVLAQAWFTRVQAQLLRKAEEQRLERQKPKVRIIPHVWTIGKIDASRNSTDKKFDGFVVINAGFTDIEITTVVFETGRVLSEEQGDPTHRIFFNPVEEYEGERISTMQLPHRLRVGESFKVLYDRDRLVGASTEVGGDQAIHMRPRCEDSFGNEHVLHHWMKYEEDLLSFQGGPSAGRISEEDWDQLPEAKKKEAPFPQTLLR